MHFLLIKRLFNKYVQDSVIKAVLNLNVDWSGGSTPAPGKRSTWNGNQHSRLKWDFKTATVILSENMGSTIRLSSSDSDNG